MSRKKRYPLPEQSCETCWWYWYTVNGDQCHHDEAQVLNDDDGSMCPWYRPGAQVKNEQNEPADIWN